MGVHGLWKLIEPSGQIVPLESLAGKVLAVDVSIWLHQAVKGMHDAQGAPLAVAHILILFHRVCKLLFYRIKPVFVFDGGVPALKHQTMVARRQRSTVAKSEVMKVREKLIKNLLKHEAVRHMLSDEAASAALGLNSFTLPGPSIEEDLYKLPPIAADYVDSECSDAPSSSDEETEKHAEDIHSIDVTSKEFLSLPAEVRHDILTELIETRKQSSWKYLETMPKKSDSFSDFQMSRLLKRHAVQTSLEKAGREMGGRALSLKELESLLGDQGVLDAKAELPGKRIAQDSVTRYMLVQKEISEPCQEAREKFDVMEHLEDVDWSSESDTDVILKKTRETSDTTEQPPGETSCGGRESKVVITEEVADILSILEDEKEKADDVQTKCNFDKADVEISEPEKNKDIQDLGTPEYVKTEVVPALESEKDKHIQDLCTKSPDHVKTEVVHVLELEKNGHIQNLCTKSPDHVKTEVVPVLEPEKNKDIQNSCTESSDHIETKIVPVCVLKPEKNEHIQDLRTESPDHVKTCVPELDRNQDRKLNNKEFQKTEPLPETTRKEFPDSEKAVESSSESDNDFVAIADVAALEGSEKTQSENKSDSFTVVIQPSEVDQKDDLFADVFESAPDKTQQESVPEFDTEFQERLLSSDVDSLKKDLEKEHADLLKERGKQERLTLNMTDQVYTDAQDLLRLFGIPFVVAPMEAEAQCATLDILGLTQGTITDDSDIWLFGGRVVYKNFFNQQKHVLEYKSENIQKCFKLTREEMIKMAMLTGSDYTMGLSGVGPVTALEIIAAFQTPNQGLIESLQKFRDWFTGAAPCGPVRATLRKKIRNVVLNPGFPNRTVVEAYLHPQVDDSKEPFSWAKPNLNLIQEYVRTKLGWSSDKCNELLMPVLKKLEESTSQSTIDRHFKILLKPSATEGLLSKRVESAIKRLGENSLESEDRPDDPKPRKRRKKITPKPESSSKNHENAEEEDSKPATKPRTNRSAASNEFPASSQNEYSKVKLINEKLHRDVKVPQKEMAQKLLEQKKKEAIKIFRTYKTGGKRKTKVYAKEEVKLSESSSEDD